MIPAGWKQALLGDHVDIFSGEAPANVTFATERGLPYVKVEDMNACAKYQSESREYVSGVRNPVPSRSVIFPKRGAAIMGNKVRIASTAIAIDTNMMALSPAATLDSEFLYYFLMHTKLFKIADTSTIPQINNKHILPYRFLLPPVAEQIYIAGILSTWDRAIETTEKLIANSQAQKKALMQQLLTGKKRLPGFSGEWRYERICDSSDRVSRRNDGQGLPILMISSTQGFVRQDEKFNRYMAGKSADDYISLRQGEFAYNKGNSKTYEFGCIFPLEGYPEALVPHVYVCFAMKAGYDASFYKVLFESDYLRPQLKRIVKTGVRNNGLLNITPSEFLETTIPVPPWDEQRAISNALSAASAAVQRLADKLEHLKAEKAALMQQLLTGKRRVKLPSAQEEAA